MKRLEFRYRVIFTVVTVVLTISFISFHFFYSYFVNRMQDNYFEDIKVMLSLLRENYLFNLRDEGGKILYSMIDQLVSDSHVRNAYLLDSTGRLVYSPIKNDRGRNIPLHAKKLIQSDQSTQLQIVALDDAHSLFRGYVPIYNDPSCYKCHDAAQKQLGYVVIDFDLKSIRKNSNMLLNFGRFFALLLILFILSSMRFLHYRTIHQGLKKFERTIDEISSGDLSKRVEIEDVEELGQLARHFNQMVEKIHEMQIELSICHQNELKNAQKLASVGEMAASLAHEIKNPLTGITNAIEVIAREISNPEYKVILQEIRYQAERVNKAINDLLQFARPIDLELEKENINDLVGQSVFFYKNQIGDSRIHFYMDLDFNLPLIKIDRKQMENVLTNLIQNAMQAIPEDQPGKIKVKTRYIAEKDLVLIAVEDNGKGIPKDHLNKIFKPFFTTRRTGTGLGLAIIQRIIEQHEGRISVESEEGRYTRFIITLPAQTAELKKDLAREEVIHGTH